MRRPDPTHSSVAIPEIGPQLLRQDLAVSDVNRQLVQLFIPDQSSSDRIKPTRTPSAAASSRTLSGQACNAPGRVRAEQLRKRERPALNLLF